MIASGANAVFQTSLPAALVYGFVLGFRALAKSRAFQKAVS
jgi:hypothetical protein